MCERAKSFELAGERDWRRDLQSLDVFEAALIARFRAPVAITVGQVVIFGLQQLDVAGAAGGAPDEFPRGKCVEHISHIAAGTNPAREPDFVVRWAEAMCFHMGADEYQNFLLARREAHREPH